MKIRSVMLGIILTLALAGAASAQTASEAVDVVFEVPEVFALEIDDNVIDFGTLDVAYNGGSVIASDSTNLRFYSNAWDPSLTVQFDGYTGPGLFATLAGGDVTVPANDDDALQRIITLNIDFGSVPLFADWTAGSIDGVVGPVYSDALTFTLAVRPADAQSSDTIQDVLFISGSHELSFTFILSAL